MLIKRLAAILTQLLMIQFAIVSGSGACPMDEASATADAAAMTMSPAAFSGGLGRADVPSRQTMAADRSHASEQPGGEHHHDGQHSGAHCAQSCVLGACTSAQCAGAGVKACTLVTSRPTNREIIAAGLDVVPSWFARAPEPPPPRA